MITKEISIEELVDKIPASVNYLMQNGIKCIACGEPIWGTLEEAAKDKGKTDIEIERYVTELNEKYL
jgi:methionine synthase II (cobalamin-independent)